MLSLGLRREEGGILRTSSVWSGYLAQELQVNERFWVGKTMSQKKVTKTFKNIFHGEESKNRYDVKNSCKRFLHFNYVYFDVIFVLISALEAQI